MNIADLFVRVRGDTTDVVRQLKGAERGLDSFGASADRAASNGEKHRLSLGRIERALASYVGHAVGANAVTEQLSTAFGSLALGGTVVTGILLGAGAIVTVYEKLTEATRKAKKEQDDLIASLEKEINLKALGPGGQTVETVRAAQARAADIKAEIDRLEKAMQSAPAGANPMTVQHQAAANAITQEKLNKLYIEYQNALNEVAGGLSIVAERTKAATDAASAGAPKVKELTFAFNQLRDLAAKVNAEATEKEKDFWRGYIDRTNEAITLTQKLLAATGLVTVDIPKVDISDSVKMAGDQAKKINDAAQRHTDQLREAIWGSALAGANTIVSALNLGGGGRNSNLGGALGSTAGFGIGFAFGGPIGGAIGSTIGNIAGSLLGGLFDHHKKAIESNTSAIRELTQAMLLNAPSVYKVARGRFDATEIKDFQRRQGLYASRGGAPVMVVP